MSLRIDTVVVGPLETNCYIVTSGDHTIVIDPGDEPNRIMDKLGLRVPEAIVLTHGHFDHVGGVEKLVDCYNAKVLCHLADSQAARRPTENGGAIHGFFDSAPRVDDHLDEGDTLTVGDAEFVVMHTPGHTIGSICLFEPNEHVLFSGDTIFQGACGRTDFPTGSLSDMKASCRRLRELPEDTMVYSGHGPATSIGREKVFNPLMR
mgnify:CR=1 FL=1